MRALSHLFDRTTLVVPIVALADHTGEIPLDGQRLSIVPLTMPFGRGLKRKLGFGFWVLRNVPAILRALLKADAVHAPIPGDIGTVGMLLAFVLRKPLFVRHCGNWLKPVTRAEHFWKWFMEKFAGGKQVMLATGGAAEPPSKTNKALRWIFSTSLSEAELQTCGTIRELRAARDFKLIIVCRQDPEKGTGMVIQSLPLILKTFPKVSLDVVGDGPSLTRFERMAADAGVADRVYFHGKLNHASVVGLLQQADLFCYPTRASEGFPKVALEALACGLPVITTRVSVLPDLIGAGGGQLLNEVTPVAIAQVVIDSLTDRARYEQMSARALETAGCYSLEAWRDTIGAQLRAAWGELQQTESHTRRNGNRKPPRVCFLAGTLGRGGAERQLIYMLAALKAAGIQTRVLSLTAGEPLEQEIRDLGIAVTWVGASKWRPLRLFSILRELRREPADILQSAHFYTNLYVAVAGRLLGVKSIGAIRNDLTTELESNGILGWGQLYLPGHLIANSKLACQRALRKGIDLENIDVVPNVVNTNGASPKVNGNRNGPVRILFSGRLTEQKRPDRFLRVLHRIVERRPGLEFIARIAGDGPWRPRLEQLAHDLGLIPKSVEFLGELEDVKPFYYDSDFLLLTSDWEGTPNVLLEAMACGLPVVATRVGGVPEIVHADSGLLVESSDEEGMTTAALRLIDELDLRRSLSWHSREHVSRSHSVTKLNAQLIEIYQKISLQ
jgi:glycosyltransferase involved in cell wall biosynthesis